MTRLSEIESHVASIGELRDIVGAMRSLAGMRVQETQRALPGIRSYAESLAAAVGSAFLLMSQPAARARPSRGRRAFVLCMAEHGFVGDFNARVLDAAKGSLQPADLLFVLGRRGAALALEHEREVAWSGPMATRVAGVTDAVQRLTGELYTRLAHGEFASVEVVFSRYHQGTGPTIERRLLLPLDTNALSITPASQPPLHNLAPRPLFESLVAEYAFALLTEAAVESMASENAARFAAMASAHDNVSKKLAKLQESARQARQAEITAELLDLMTGARAQRNPSSGHRHRPVPIA